MSDKITFAEKILDHSMSMITLADTKAGVLLGIAGIVIALLFGVDRTALGEAGQFFLIGTMISFGISSFFSVSTLIPRLTDEAKTTRIYFKKVQEMTRDEYVNSWQHVTSADILSDYLMNIHNLSIVQKKKYFDLRIAVIFNIIGIILMIGVISTVYLFSTVATNNS
jgi:hypothetical protein